MCRAGDESEEAFVVDDCDGQRVVRVRGAVDLANAERFAAALEHTLAIEPDGDVVVDLGAVEFMDSTGLRVLLNARQQSGGRVRVSTASRVVERLFEITGMSGLFRDE